jgi:predicted Rossmann fold nucleotide-binding protein DprA/Smf involved in DNA uptake
VSTVDEAIAKLNERLVEIEREIGVLQAEAAAVQRALETLQGVGTEPPSPPRTRVRAQRAKTPAAPTVAAAPAAAAAPIAPTATAAPTAPATPVVLDELAADDVPDAPSTSGSRAPRGANRQSILQAIQGEAKTAAQVAEETGIKRGTVATTLVKLVEENAAIKANLGYRAL